MYKGIKMHRTQIYFEEELFEALKKQANGLGLSLSAYIRNTLKEDLDERKKQPQVLDFTDFSGMWKNREITQASIREKAWK